MLNYVCLFLFCGNEKRPRNSEQIRAIPAMKRKEIEQYIYSSHRYIETNGASIMRKKEKKTNARASPRHAVQNGANRSEAASGLVRFLEI
jgi:hypothetical protein